MIALGICLGDHRQQGCDFGAPEKLKKVPNWDAAMILWKAKHGDEPATEYPRHRFIDDPT